MNLERERRQGARDLFGEVGLLEKIAELPGHGPVEAVLRLVRLLEQHGRHLARELEVMDELAQILGGLGDLLDPLLDRAPHPLAKHPLHQTPRALPGLTRLGLAVVRLIARRSFAVGHGPA